MKQSEASCLVPNHLISPRAMGLSGATKKQRIQDDPRNLRWAQGEPCLSASFFRSFSSLRLSLCSIDLGLSR